MTTLNVRWLWRKISVVRRHYVRPQPAIKVHCLSSVKCELSHKSCFSAPHSPTSPSSRYQRGWDNPSFPSLFSLLGVSGTITTSPIPLPFIISWPYLQVRGNFFLHVVPVVIKAARVASLDPSFFLNVKEISKSIFSGIAKVCFNSSIIVQTQVNDFSPRGGGWSRVLQLYQKVSSLATCLWGAT